MAGGAAVAHLSRSKAVAGKGIIATLLGSERTLNPYAVMGCVMSMVVKGKVKEGSSGHQ